jgi:chitobiase/beta-hexosaminidase-like protein
MGNPFHALVSAPVLERIEQILRLFVTDDYSLRQQQTNNAPMSAYFIQGTLGATVVNIPQAQSGDQAFTSAFINFDSGASAVRYTVDGTTPTAAGVGFQFPSGGGPLQINGAQNIKKFQMICEGGGSAAFEIGVFK